jgi:hypothetical protein
MTATAKRPYAVVMLDGKRIRVEDVTAAIIVAEIKAAPPKSGWKFIEACLECKTPCTFAAYCRCCDGVKTYNQHRHLMTTAEFLERATARTAA